MTLCQVFVFLSGVVSMVKTVLSMIGSVLCLSACQVGVNPPSYVRPWTPAVAAIALPTPTESAPVPVPTAWPRYIAPPPKASALPELAPSPGVSADEGKAVTGPAAVCCAGTVASGASGGSGGSATSDGFFISDVVLAETGESVMGEGAPAALAFSYTTSEPLFLNIKGRFMAAPPLSEPLMRFSYEPGLLHQTFSATQTEPSVRVLLNDSLLLTPVSVTAQEIQLSLEGQFLLDVQENGLQRIKLIAGAQSVEKQIKVENTIPSILYPEIDTIRAFSQGGNKWLEIVGSNFFINPRKNNLFLQNTVLAVQFVEVSTGGKAALWALVPEATQVEVDDTVLLSTPFGTTPGKVQYVEY